MGRLTVRVGQGVARALEAADAIGNGALVAAGRARAGTEDGADAIGAVGVPVADEIEIAAEVAALAVVVGEHGKAAAIEGVTERAADLVGFVGRRPELAGQLQAVEVAARDDVDHAGHRFRAIGRRRAVGQHLDPLDHVDGELVGVGEKLAGVVGHRSQTGAAAVHQRQGRPDAEPAQRELRDALQGVLAVRGLRAGVDRQALEHILQADRPGVLDFRFPDGLHRGRRLKVLLLPHVGAGDDDHFNRLVLRGRRHRSGSRQACDPNRDCGRRAQQACAAVRAWEISLGISFLGHSSVSSRPVRSLMRSMLGEGLCIFSLLN